MNAEEAVVICRLVKEACPGQKFGEYTADIWTPMLADVGFQPAKEAIIEVGKRQPWISPSDIIAEVRRARGALPSDRPLRDAIAESERAVAEDRRRLEIEQ